VSRSISESIDCELEVNGTTDEGSEEVARGSDDPEFSAQMAHWSSGKDQ